MEKNIEFHDSVLLGFDYANNNIVMKFENVCVDNLYKNVMLICKNVSFAQAENSYPIGMLYEDGEINFLEIRGSDIEMLVEWCDYNNHNLSDSLTFVLYKIKCEQIEINVGDLTESKLHPTHDRVL